MRLIRDLPRAASGHAFSLVPRRPAVIPLSVGVLVLLILRVGVPVAAQPADVDADADEEGPTTGAVEPPVSLNALKPERRRELQHLLEDVRDPDLDLERRRRAAAILLDREWPAAVQALRRELIGGAHPSTLRAIAQAVAEDEGPDEQLVPALLELLKREEAELRRDVASALGRFDSDGLRQRLIALATDPQNPTPLRLGAIRALAEHRTQPAARALLDVAENGGPAERQTAFKALAQLTGLQELGEDLEAWKRWWGRAKERSERRWRTLLMRNLSARNAEVMERLRGVRERVVEAHQQLYNATEEAGRPEMIGRLLDDPMPELRLLALKLIDRRLLNAQPISDPVRQAMRRRLTDPSAEVRARAAQLLENLADARGAEIANGLLLAETDVEVQARFLSLLARVPRAEAVEPALLLMGRPALRGPAASVLVAAHQADLLRPDQAWRALATARDHLEAAERPEPAVLRLVGWLGEGSDQSLLVDRMDHESAVVRLAAAEALASGERWPLAPLLDRLDDPVLRPVAFRVVARRGEGAAVVERLLNHEPEGSQDRPGWLDAVRSVAGRLDRAGVERLDKLLAERPDRRELHEQLLRAAAGLDGDMEAERGQAAAGEIAARVEASLRLCDLYMADGRLEEAGRVHAAVAEEATGEALEEAQRHRLTLTRLRLLLASERSIEAAAHTRSVLEAGAPPADSLAECWVEALERAQEAERMDVAQELARRTRELFEGRVAAQSVLSSEALRQTLEQAGSTP